MNIQIVVIMSVLLLNICAFGGETVDAGSWEDQWIQRPLIEGVRHDDQQLDPLLLESSDGSDVFGNPAQDIDFRFRGRNANSCRKKTEAHMRSVHSTPLLRNREGSLFYDDANHYFNELRLEAQKKGIQNENDPSLVMKPCKQEYRSAKKIRLVIDKGGRDNDTNYRRSDGSIDTKKSKITTDADGFKRRQRLMIEVEFEPSPLTGGKPQTVRHSIAASMGEPFRTANAPKPGKAQAPTEMTILVDKAYATSGLPRPVKFDDLTEKNLERIHHITRPPEYYRSHFSSSADRNAAVARNYAHTRLARRLKMIHGKDYQLTFQDLDKYIASSKRNGREPRLIQPLGKAHLWDEYRTTVKRPDNKMGQRRLDNPELRRDYRGNLRFNDRGQKISRIHDTQAHCNSATNQSYFAAMPYAIFFEDGKAIHGRSHVSGGALSHGCAGIDTEQARQLYCLLRQENKETGVQNWENTTVEVHNDADFVPAAPPAKPYIQ